MGRRPRATDSLSSFDPLTENHFLEELRGSLFERAEDKEHGRRDDDGFATPNIGYTSGDEAANQGAVEGGHHDPRLLAEGKLSSAEGRPDGEESTRGDSGIVATAKKGRKGAALALYRLY